MRESRGRQERPGLAGQEPEHLATDTWDGRTSMAPRGSSSLTTSA